MCAPSPPPPADLVGAAKQQGIENVAAARATAQLNNPNVISPYGTQTTTYNGDIPTMTQTFSPEQQALYEKQTRVKGLLGDLGVSGATGLGDIIGKNLDLSSLPQAPGTASDTRQKVINAMMGRVDEDVGRQREQSNSDLIAAGIHPGTKAYDDAMFQITRGRNDALQQAQIAAGGEASRDYGMDAQRRQTALAELLAQRQTPLNEVTALQSGSQVSNPFAGGLGYQGGAVTAPAPVFAGAQAQSQAAMDAYAQQVAGSNAMLGGLFGLGAAGITHSDRRLKSDILPLNLLPNGLRLYEYTIAGHRERGVMADEVRRLMPSAVVTGVDDFDRVNYHALGLHSYPERVRG